MQQILVIEVLGYFGILLLQSIWAARGVLTEHVFALVQVASLSLIMITVVLFSSTPDYPFGVLVGSMGAIIFSAVGYPIARWIYRQSFPPK